ncbi:hypothetical protein ACPXCG_21250 [Gordonia sp. DT218]|uniref:hypothetical protein n=1 Tax=Gordonia sp. DT218 TaxID=3416659 RepID=UPI003CFA6F86
MGTTWSAEQLGAVDSAGELEIAVRRAEGDLRGWVPIWVVRADVDAAYRQKYGRYGVVTVDRMVSDSAAQAAPEADA